jgi:hypothetical protein
MLLKGASDIFIKRDEAPQTAGLSGALPVKG